jgi:hypothetical protein
MGDRHPKFVRRTTNLNFRGQNDQRNEQGSPPPYIWRNVSVEPALHCRENCVSSRWVAPFRTVLPPATSRKGSLVVTVPWLVTIGSEEQSSSSSAWTYQFSMWRYNKNLLRNFFIIKPNKCTKFTNLFWHETLHVSGSSSVHQQAFIHCTLENGICHTGL